MAERPLTQVELAAVLEVTQQSVSHVLRGHRFATRTDREWVIGQRAEALDGLLAEYPGPGGVDVLVRTRSCGAADGGGRTMVR